MNMENDIMEIKSRVKAIDEKFDAYIGHQKEVCELHRKPLDASIKGLKAFKNMVIIAIVGGFFWLIRK